MRGIKAFSGSIMTGSQGLQSFLGSGLNDAVGNFYSCLMGPG